MGTSEIFNKYERSDETEIKKPKDKLSKRNTQQGLETYI
jgi:hypothetical protein